MKDEEKAREIAIKIEKESSFLKGFGKQEIVIKEIENAAIQMSAWKEQQIVNWLKEHINDYIVNGRDIDLMFEDLKQAL